jgi:hypothetical protein
VRQENDGMVSRHKNDATGGPELGGISAKKRELATDQRELGGPGPQPVSGFLPNEADFMPFA